MNFAIREILAPVLARSGTAIAGYIAGTGVASTEAEKIAIGAVALILVIVDLIVGHFTRKAASK